jgi:hypothetical protein
LSWHSKRNFTLQLAYPDDNNAKDAFTGGSVTGGSLQDPSDNKNPKPATYTLTDASWIICAVNTMGQQRFQMTSFNGWCWDGVSRRQMWNGLGMQLSYFAFVTPYSQPSGYCIVIASRVCSLLT